MSAGLWVHSIWVQNNFVCTLQVPFYHRVLVTRSKWNKTCVQSTLGTFKIILFSPIYINDRTLVRIPGLISCIYFWDCRTESRFYKQTAKPWPGRYSNRLLFISIRLKISFFSIFISQNDRKNELEIYLAECTQAPALKLHSVDHSRWVEKFNQRP